LAIYHATGRRPSLSDDSDDSSDLSDDSDDAEDLERERLLEELRKGEDVLPDINRVLAEKRLLATVKQELKADSRVALKHLEDTANDVALYQYMAMHEDAVLQEEWHYESGLKRARNAHKQKKVKRVPVSQEKLALLGKTQEQLDAENEWYEQPHAAHEAAVVTEERKVALKFDGGGMDTSAIRAMAVLAGSSSGPELETHSNTSVCQFKAIHPDTGARYECRNTVIKNPSNGVWTSFCGFHTTKCEMAHPNVLGDVKIKVRNELGLCGAHYVAKAGHKAVPHLDPWQFPGVVQKSKGNTEPGRNPMAPLISPYFEEVEDDFEEIEELTNFQEALQFLKSHLQAAGFFKKAEAVAPEETGASEVTRTKDQVEGSGKKPELVKQGTGILQVAPCPHHQALSFSPPSLSLSLPPTKCLHAISPPIPLSQAPMAKNVLGRLGETLGRKMAPNEDGKKSWLYRKVYHPLFLRNPLKMKWATVKAQSFLRMLLAQKQLLYLTLSKEIKARHAAALVIQVRARTINGRRWYLKHYANCVKASILIQTHCRGYRLRRTIKINKSSRQITGAIRSFISWRLVKAIRIQVMIRREFEAREWGSSTLQRVTRGLFGRERARQRKEYYIRNYVAARCIQCARRRYVAVCKLWELVRLFHLHTAKAIVIQTRIRMIQGRAYARWKKINDTACAIIIQKYLRRLGCRLAAARERELVDHAWKWLNPVQDRKAFEKYMSRSTYGLPMPVALARSSWRNTREQRVKDLFDSKTLPQGTLVVKEVANKGTYLEVSTLQGVESIQSCTNTDNDESWAQFMDSTIAKSSVELGTLPGSEEFKKYDPHGFGFVTKKQFRDVLDIIWHGPLTKREARFYMNKFDVYHDGQVDYRLFLKYTLHKKKRAEARGQQQDISFGQFQKILNKKPHKDMHQGTDAIEDVNFSKADMGGAQRSVEDAIRDECAQIRLEMERREKSELAVRTDTLQVCEKAMHALSRDLKPEVSSEWNSSTLTRDYRRLPGKASKMFASVGDIPKLRPSTTNSFVHTGGITEADSSNKSYNELHDFEALEVGSTVHRLFDGSKVKALEYLQARPATCAQTSPADGLSRGTSNLLSGTEALEVGNITKSILDAREEKVRLNGKITSNRLTKKELEKGFTIRDAVPFMHKGNIHITLDVAELYVDLLLALSDPDVMLLEREDVFLSFLLSCSVFIERHWKKLIIDIRTGTLNKNVDVDADVRMALDERLKPNPARATMFEEKLRALNFHQRASEGDGEQGLGLNTLQFKKLPDPDEIYTIKRANDDLVLSVVGLGANQDVEKSGGGSLTPRTNFGSGTSHEDLYSTGYQMVTKARKKMDPVVRQKGRGIRKYTCSFPACGKSFQTISEANLHATTVHHNAKRMAVSSPEIDQYMAPFWPAKSPWKAKLVKEDKSLEPFACKQCDRRFETRKILEQHVGKKHSSEEIVDDTVKLVGGGKGVPYNSRVPTKSDSVHSRDGPAPCPPFKFFTGLAITINKDDDDRQQLLEFSILDGSRVPLVLEPHQQGARPINPLSFCKDHNGKCWVACSRFCTLHEAMECRYKLDLARGFDKTSELLETVEVEYIDIRSICGEGYILLCSKNEFHRQKKNSAYPKGCVLFFSRDSFSRITGAHAGPRTLPSPAESGPKRGGKGKKVLPRKGKTPAKGK
jgi:hypothetical protein